MLGAAGAIEFIACTLAIATARAADDQPPTPTRSATLDVTPNTPRRARDRRRDQQQLGFGGHNVTLAVRRLPS
jgi:3-oxoacyl-[acyl-carrier-protein] synthase II